MTLRIIPLRVGSAPLVFPETGTKITYFMFAIVGGARPIMVDTATPSRATTLLRQGFELDRPPEEEPIAALSAIGIDPAEVRTILQTHLHWDHAGNGALFPQAEFVVQEDELRYAVAPPMTERIMYDLLPGAGPEWLLDIPRMRTVRGDVSVAPGIRTLLLPGHTPGSQGVLVETAHGSHLIAGDTVPSYAHWRGDRVRRHLLGPITDAVAYNRTLERIDALQAEVIPSHDPLLTEHGPFG